LASASIRIDVKVGLVTAEYAPMQGGVGDFTREVARALVVLGHHVHVITNLNSQLSSLKSEDDDVQVERVIDGWGWGCWRSLRDVAERLRLDVINIQYQAAAYKMHPAINLFPLARRLDPFIRWPHLLPIVVTFHDLKVPYLFPKAGSLRRQAVWALAGYSDAVIVTNLEDELVLRAETDHSLKKSPKSEIARIPIGSNIALRLPEEYNRDEWRARWKVRPDEILIGYFGFLHPLKGGPRLCGQVVAHRRAHWLIRPKHECRLCHAGGIAGARAGRGRPDRRDGVYAAGSGDGELFCDGRVCAAVRRRSQLAARDVSRGAGARTRYRHNAARPSA
jgi:glycosyltransferase involved in cell wall biosynthesis